MSITVMVRDETTLGDVYDDRPLEFSSERVTVRDLIRERVYQEVIDFNQKSNEVVFRGLVQPADTERELNGDRNNYRMKFHRVIDWNEMFQAAVEAFEKHQFLILVGPKQAESLDQQFTIQHGTQVTFLKLTLLVGG